MTNKPETRAEALARFNEIAKDATPAPWEADTERNKNTLEGHTTISRGGIGYAHLGWKRFAQVVTEVEYEPDAEGEANLHLILNAHDILKLANHQAKVIEGMRGFLGEVEAHHAEQNRLKGRDESRSKTLAIIRKGIALADAPYGETK
jgi:hypothetical protein